MQGFMNSNSHTSGSRTAAACTSAHLSTRLDTAEILAVSFCVVSLLDRIILAILGGFS